MKDINEVKNNILNIREKLENFLSRHEDDMDFKDEIIDTMNSNNFESKDSIIQDFNNNVDLDRTLNIGIVGRVKAGKSSLINALLFDGKDILPKAATPMTAALTHIQYSDKNYVEIDFITQKDVDNIYRVYDEFNQSVFNRVESEKNNQGILNKATDFINKQLGGGETSSNNHNDNISLEEKIKKEILENNERYAKNYESYIALENIKKSNIAVYNDVLSNSTQRVEFNDITEISSKLEKYVGANGVYTNFVKSLNIYINKEELKDISLLDTPGFNDPVESRNRKANELLSKCDVILILMLSDNVFTSNDKSVLGKIVKKNGVQEIYVVVSQFDGALLSDSNVSKANGNLELAFTNIKDNMNTFISKHLREVDEDVFQDVIYDVSSRVLYSSSISYNIIKNWGNWTEAEELTFNNLSKSYPDYFDKSQKEIAIGHLEKIANIENIKNILNKVADNKDKILNDKLNNFERKYLNSSSDIKERLKEYIKKRERRIENLDIDKILNQIEENEKMYDKLQEDIDYKAEAIIDNWFVEAHTRGTNILNNFFKDTTSKNIEAQGESHRTEGMWWWKKNITYTTIDTVKVISSLNNYKTSFNQQMEITLKNVYLELREALIEGIFKMISNYDIDISEAIIYKVIKNTIQEYSSKNIFYNRDIEINHYEGTLTEEAADRFIKKSNNIIENMREDFYKTFKDENLKSFCNKIKKISFGNALLERHKFNLLVSKEEFENQKQAEDKWNRIKKELETLF